jgi:DNA-binding transcriptional MocR family regulator
MEPFTPLSLVDQLVAHLRRAISTGELGDSMPGIRCLASTLDVSANTVTAALERLEHEGFLEPQGHGCRSRIVLPKNFVRKAYRVTLLLYEREDLQLSYVVEIQQQLKEKGHEVHIAEKSLVDLGMNVSRISRMVNHAKTDAWVVFSAPREVLEWFAAHSVPAAGGGRA